MAALVLTDAKVVINTVNLSDHVHQVTLDITADTPESTAMGATYRARLAGGLKDATMTVEFNQDFAAANVDATLFPLLGVSTAVTVKASSAANSATNPEYQFNAILDNYQPIGNAVGDRAAATAHFVVNGPVTRAVV